LGDHQEKLVELLETSGTRLHALLGRLTLDEHATSDLIQELFVRLSGSSGFDRAKDPSSYAFRVAINLAFEWRRKRRIKFQALEEESLPDDAGISALERMVRTEELNEVLDATAQLSELARAVVVMHYIEQLSYEEIAQHLGKKPQHLRSVSAKAMARLRAMFASQNLYA
jgi:RNA polymerase sigma-70 factor (ECF subfamily)